MKIKNLFIGGTSNTFIQFFRSLFVGGIATVVDMLVMILVREAFHVPEGVAAMLGFIIGLAVNYVICSFWVFAKAKVKNRLTDFIGFTIIGIIGLGLTQLIIEPFATDGMFGTGVFVQWEIFSGLIPTDNFPTDKYYIVGKVIAVVVVYMWNFFARKFILYRKCEVEEGSPEEAALKEKREKQAKKKAEKKAKAKAEKKKKAKKAAKQKKAEKKAQADKKAREEAVRRNTK